MTRQGTHLNSARRRGRKAQLAARDGMRCTYCRCSFASLREATLDHVAPLSLLHTWAARHLVLACRPCNTRKADRLPLSLALLLLWSTDPTQPASAQLDTADRKALTSVTSRVTPRPVDSRPPVNTPSFTDAFTVFSDSTTSTFDRVDWLLLARLAHARQSTNPTCEQSDEHPREHREQSDVHRERSGAHQHFEPLDRVDRSPRTRLRARLPIEACAAPKEAA
ncbi:HNH endonuclease signature motif containing protein [Streptomyces sp. NPDC051994]|uniref:HNH endonuclease n=1 Tax=unclassified Streptomyces TaxID=2593676 RepID=UPI00343BEB44